MELNLSNAKYFSMSEQKVKKKVTCENSTPRINSASGYVPSDTMSSTGSDFDDDDDDLLLAVMRGEANVANGDVVPTQVPALFKANYTSPEKLHPSTNEQDRIFQAEGEVAILRAQLKEAQEERRREIQSLRQSKDEIENSADSEIKVLKAAVKKLEDEKKFLNNELKTTSAHFKKRKTNESERQIPSTVKSKSTTPSSEGPIHKIIKLNDDSSVLINHLWSHCIIGSQRTSFSYLSKICIDFDLQLENIKIPKKTSMFSSIVEFLVLNKNLRLDELISMICSKFIELVLILVQKEALLAVPFILSLVHHAITFRPSAVKKELIVHLLKEIQGLVSKLSYVLESNYGHFGLADDSDMLLQQSGDEEKFLNIENDKTPQEVILENYSFICCFDIIEKLVTTASMHELDFIRHIWLDQMLSVEMLNKCLPENSERIKSSTQINLVYNYVEMLMSSITDETFGIQEYERAETLLNSLLKFFFIEVSIKENFMFFGLNRLIGNNKDFTKIDSLIPVEKDLLNNYLVSSPQPIPHQELEKALAQERFEIQHNHEFHLLNLKVKIGNLLEAYIVTNQSVEFLAQKESFKLLIRIIGFEQNSIMRFPRSKFDILRLQIIAIVVRIIFFLTQDNSHLNSLMYPETMFELFVVMLRIAFGSNSLSLEASKLLTKMRSSGFLNHHVLNHWAESRARELSHLTMSFDATAIANAQIDFPNALEFPYEESTIEMSREILNLFVNHDEADNMYFNMNCQDEKDDDHDEEMAMVE